MSGSHKPRRSWRHRVCVPHPCNTVPQVEIETIAERRFEQGRDRAVEIGRADAGNVDRVEPVGVFGLRQRTTQRLQGSAQ